MYSAKLKQKHCALIDVSNPEFIVRFERDKWYQREEAKHEALLFWVVLIEGNLE